MGYSNSPLVDYTKKSPMNSGYKTHAIDRITPHCVVGQCSVEALGAIFQTKEASSNYGIGVDGRVGMYVEERGISWCSSNQANDNRAVTIECASDAYAPYAFKDVVYNKLIELCVDICKRYDKKKLLWISDKNKALAYEPKSDEMLLTVHRWFEAKSCPGDWMYERMGDLAAKVTDKLNPKPEYTIKYSIKANGKKQNNIMDGATAGTDGQKITDLAVKSSIYDIKYKVHILGGEWTDYVTGFSWTDEKNGNAGCGKPIDAIQVNVIGSHKAKYRVSDTTSGKYGSWQKDNERTDSQKGYAGTYGKAIDKIQIVVE